MPQDDPRFSGNMASRTMRRVRDGWHGSVTRRLTARGPVPDSFTFKPQEMALGSPENAAALLRGQFALAGTSVRVERGDPWRADAPNTAWSEALHGFGWLRDFRASDNDAARKAARKFVASWLSMHGKVGGLAWRPGICGDRVTAWCMNAELITENAEPAYRNDAFRSLTAQARYLLRTGPGEPIPLDRLRAARGAVYAALCIRGEGGLLGRALAQVVEATQATLLSDGGAASRSPSDLLYAVEMLVQLRDDIREAGEGALSAKLSPFIERAVPVLRMLRMGDGSLALFHGGRAEDTGRINLALVESGDVKPAPEDAPKSGYLRLNAGGATVLFDAGQPAENSYARRSHAGQLALMFSSGERQIIVNCGSGVHLDPGWEAPCRASAAHSTLTIAERSPCAFEGKPDQRNRKITQIPRIVDRQSERDDSGIWALAAHDGYAPRYGLIHYRRVFLDSRGVDMRGEDTLTLAKGGARVLERSRAKRKSPDGPGFAIRFHLHPDVTPTVKDGQARLILPDGEEWLMIQSGGKLSIEDSVYIPHVAAPAQTKQIVIESALRDTEGQVRWALKRVTGRAKPTPTEEETE